MPGDSTTVYNTSEGAFDIPNEKQDAFLKKYPDARRVYVSGEDTFAIPKEKEQSFLNKYPNAKPLKLEKGASSQETELPPYAPQVVKQFQDQVNNGTETQNIKQQKEDAEQALLENVVGNALHSKVSDKPLKDPGQSKLNDDGSVSYIDAQGHYQIVNPHDVDTVFRKKQEAYNVKVRSEAPPMQKAAYAVADYLGGAITDIRDGIPEFIKAVTPEQFGGTPVSSAKDWAKKTVDALTSATKVVMGTAKLAPPTAGAMALWTGGTNAALLATENLKDDPEFHAQALYHAVRLLTDPYAYGRKAYGAITGKDLGEESKTEQEIQGLVDNLTFIVGAHLAAKGINSVRDIPHTTDVNIPVEANGEPAPVTDYATEKAEKDKNTQILNILDKLRNSKPLDVADLPVVQEIVSQAPDKVIEEARATTSEKQETNAATLAKQRRVSSELSSVNDLNGDKKEVLPTATRTWMRLPTSAEIRELPNLKNKLGRLPVTGQIGEINKAFQTGAIHNALRERRISWDAATKLLESAGIDIPPEFYKEPYFSPTRDLAAKIIRNDKAEPENKVPLTPEEQKTVDTKPDVVAKEIEAINKDRGEVEEKPKTEEKAPEPYVPIGNPEQDKAGMEEWEKKHADYKKGGEEPNKEEGGFKGISPERIGLLQQLGVIPKPLDPLVEGEFKRNKKGELTKQRVDADDVEVRNQQIKERNAKIEDEVRRENDKERKVFEDNQNRKNNIAKQKQAAKELADKLAAEEKEKADKEAADKVEAEKNKPVTPETPESKEGENKDTRVEDFTNAGKELQSAEKNYANSSQAYFSIRREADIANGELKKAEEAVKNAKNEEEKNKAIDNLFDIKEKAKELEDRAKEALKKQEDDYAKWRDARNKYLSLYKDLTDNPPNQSPAPKVGEPEKVEPDPNLPTIDKKGNIDYNSGKPTEFKEGDTEAEANRIISERSKNPAEIIHAYEQEREKVQDKASDPKKNAIQDAISSGVLRDSYFSMGDRNKVGAGMAKQFFKTKENGGRPIDAIAQSASQYFNPDDDSFNSISVQDVVDYMEGAKYEPKRNKTMLDLEARFKEITGQPLSEKQIRLNNDFQQEEFKKLNNGKESELSNEDFWKQSPEEIAAQLDAARENAKGVDNNEGEQRDKENPPKGGINPDDLKRAAIPVPKFVSDIVNKVTKPVTDAISAVAKGINKNFDAYKKAINETADILPPKTNLRKFTAATWEMGKSLANRNLLKDYFYKKGNQSLADIENKGALRNAQDITQATTQEGIKAYSDDPATLKQYLQEEAIKHWGLADSNPDLKEQSEQTGNSLALISDMIREGNDGKDDIKWINKILSKQNKLTIDGEVKTAWTIEQMKLLKEVGRPEQPITPQQYNAINAALSPFDAHVKEFKVTPSDVIGDLFGNKAAKFTDKGIKWTDKNGKLLENSVRYPQHAWRLASKKMQPIAKGLYNSYLSALKGDDIERRTNFERNISPDYINYNYTKRQQNNVAKIREKGHYVDRQYYNDGELKVQGLTPSEIGLYHHLNSAMEQVRGWLREARREGMDYHNMTPEQKLVADDNEPEWMKANNGYIHLRRSGDHYVIYHGLNPESGREEVQHEMFETSKEANERAKELNTQTYDYQGDGEKEPRKKNYRGVTSGGLDDEGHKIYTRNEKESPVVREVEDFDPGMLKALSLKDPDVLYDLAGKSGINRNSIEYAKLEKYINNIKKEKGYIPSLTFKSNRIPGAPVDMASQLQSLRALASQASHLLARNKSDNVFTKNIEPLRQSNNTRDKRVVNYFNEFHQQMKQQGADNKIVYLIQKALAASYLNIKPAFLFEQYWKNVSTMPPEMIDRLQKMDIGAGKSDAIVAKLMVESHIKGHEFGAGKIYPKGTDAFGRKISTSKWVDNPDDLISRIMNRIFNRGGISSNELDWVTDNDGNLSTKNKARRDWVMGHAPTFTRSSAAYAGVKLGIMSGIKDEEELLHYAEDFLYDTKYRFGKQNRPAILQGGSNQYQNGITNVVRLLTTFQNTHANYIQWFYHDMANIHKDLYKVAPRALLGGAALSTPIIGQIIMNGFNNAITAHHNANEPDSKKHKDNYNWFSPTGDVATNASIDNSSLPEWLKDGMQNGAVDALAHSMGIKGGINTKQLVGLGHDHIQDFTPFGKGLGMFGTPYQRAHLMAIDLWNGDLGQALKDAPSTTVQNVIKAIDWHTYGHKFSNNMDYSPTGFEGIQMAMGFVPDRLKNYYDATTLRKSMSDDKKDIEKDFKETLDKTFKNGKEADIERYYFDPSEENKVKLFGKDFQKGLDKYNNSLHDGVTALYRASDMTNDGKLDDLGNWMQLHISSDYSDSTYLTTHPKDKSGNELSTVKWMQDWILNTTDKERKDSPELSDLYNDALKKSKTKPSSEDLIQRDIDNK